MKAHSSIIMVGLSDDDWGEYEKETVISPWHHYALLNFIVNINSRFFSIKNFSTHRVKKSLNSFFSSSLFNKCVDCDSNETWVQQSNSRELIFIRGMRSLGGDQRQIHQKYRFRFFHENNKLFFKREMWWR